MQLESQYLRQIYKIGDELDLGVVTSRGSETHDALENKMKKCQESEFI